MCDVVLYLLILRSILDHLYEYILQMQFVNAFDLVIVLEYFDKFLISIIENISIVVFLHRHYLEYLYGRALTSLVYTVLLRSIST